MVKHAVLVLCFAAFFIPGKSQSTANASANLPVIVKAGDVYNPFIQKQSRLYNGIEHLGYNPRIKGHAYYIEKDLQTGTVTYDGLEFANVLMIYDLLKDQLIVQHINGFSKIGLVSEKVKEFTIHTHHFIRLVADTVSRSPITTGFYDEVYKGRLNVLVRRGKFIEETIKDELEREFIPLTFFFIQKEGVYYPVKNYKGLMALLKDRSKEVKQYLRKNKIKYRKGAEYAIVKAVEYYDSINK
jgi:hypothetical protein